MTIPLDLEATSIYCTTTTGLAVLPRCTSFRYLGGNMPNAAADMKQRIGQAWGAINKLNRIWTSPAMDDKKKMALFCSLVEPVLLYNAETWTMTQCQDSILNATQAAAPPLRSTR